MLFCTRHTRAILPLHTHCKTLFNLCQRHFGDIPAGDIPNDSSDIHNIGAFFHLFSLSQIGKLQPCVSPPTATCHVWCCCDKNHGAASGDGLHMLMALFAVEPCWNRTNLDLVSRGINQFYVYVCVYVCVYIGYTRCTPVVCGHFCYLQNGIRQCQRHG